METKQIKIIVKDPYGKSEKVIEKEILPSTLKKLEKLLETQDIVLKDKVIYEIQNLNIPAEAKAILVKIADLTITIGNRVLSIGKRILELTLYIVREYPNATTGLVVGAVIGLAFNFIPIIGHFISTIVTPLCMALGLAVGFWKDMKDKALKERIEKELREQLGALKDIK
jgi:hypothetical protein